MNRKKILKNLMISGILGATIFFSSNKVANAQMKVYEDIPKGITAHQLESMSIQISKETNPEYYSQSNWEQGVYQIDPSKIPFDGNIYYDIRDTNLSSNQKTFYKILEYSKGRDVNLVVIKYGTGAILDGKVYEGSPLTVEVYSEEKYKYILNNEEYNKQEPSDITQNPSSPQITPSINNIDSSVDTSSKKVVSREWGSTRIETSIAIAEKIKGDKAKHNSVILAVASDFPDALTGGVLTKKYDAPIVLTNQNIFNSKKTLDYVINNVDKDGYVILLGGSGVIEDSIRNYLVENGFKNIKRLGGLNRYETNYEIIKDLNPSNGTPVIIASSLDFPDALSIAPIAAKNGYPIFISKNDIDSKTLDYITSINPSKVYIVGGTGVISSETEKKLKGISKDVVRLGGYTRYETSLAIAEQFNSNSKNVTIASGFDFPDALSGAYLACKNDSSILIVNESNTALQKEYIDKYNKDNILVLGGIGAVSDRIIEKLIK